MRNRLTCRLCCRRNIELVINLKTAKALGITIPRDAVGYRRQEVIQ